MPLAAAVRDHEAHAPGVAIAREPQARRGVRVRGDDDVLQRFAQAGFDRTLVAAVDLEIVGDRSHLSDVLGRLGEDGAGAVAILRASGVELLERGQAREERGEIVLAGAQLGRAAVAIGSRADELRFAGGAIDAQLLHRRPRAVERVGGGVTLGGGARGFDAEIVILDLERRDLLGHPRAGRNRVLHRVPQGRRGVDRGEHLAARRFDVGLQTLRSDAGRPRTPLLRPRASRPPRRVRRRRAAPRRGARRARGGPAPAARRARALPSRSRRPRSSAARFADGRRQSAAGAGRSPSRSRERLRARRSPGHRPPSARAADVRASFRARRASRRQPSRAHAHRRARFAPCRWPGRARRYFCANWTFSHRRSSSRSRL